VMLGAAVADTLLEEVEHGNEGPYDVWLITLSVPGRTGIGVLGRDYKRCVVRADTGEVLSMKIRELAGA